MLSLITNFMQFIQNKRALHMEYNIGKMNST